MVGRFLLALGSGVGLKMTFTLVNECYSPKEASQKISYLLPAFAIAPGIAVALGGFLNANFGWMSCFYLSALYGVILLLLVIKLPETLKERDPNAFKIKHLLHAYALQFKNKRLVSGGVIWGLSTSFIYIFAALAPFIAINLLDMSSEAYGMANILPPIGLIVGSLLSARLAKNYPLTHLLKIGIAIITLGTLLLFATMFKELPPLYALFLPMIVLYIGLSFIPANASTLAMHQVEDKAHGSAVLNFSNMSVATIAVLCLGLLPIKVMLLPLLFLVLSILMIFLYATSFSK